MRTQLNMSWLSKFLIVFAISFQMVFGFAPVVHAADEPNGGTLPDKLAKSGQTPYVRDQAALWDAAATAVEKDDIGSLPDSNPNPYHFAGDRVEIDGHVYDLDKYQVEIPTVTFTSLRANYDAQKRELIFEGIVGQNDRGEHGKVVARHIKTNVDIAALTMDEELLSAVDSAGNYSAIPMDYVAGNIFKKKLPIFEKLWSPLVDLRGQKFEISYVTLGAKPPDFSNAGVQAVLPRDAEGHIDINAGDAMIYTVGNNGERNLVGVFSREVTYSEIIAGFENLIAMLPLIVPANIGEANVKQVVGMVDRATVTDPDFADPNEIPEVLRHALLHFSDQQLKQMNGSIAQQQHRAARQFHKLTPSDWSNVYLEIDRVAREESARLGESTDEESTYQKSQLDEMIARGDYSSSWQDLYKKSNLMPKAEIRTAQRSWIRDVSKKSLEYLWPLLIIVPAWGFPYAFEHIETMKQIHVLNWMYEHAVGPVLKDQAYRQTNLASVLKQIALWPASVVAAMAAGRGLRYLAKILSTSTSRPAQYIRDMARTWAPLSNWQRITTFGIRFFSIVIYPFLQWPLAIARQPTMASAFSNGLNPFKKVRADSSLGRKIGADRDFRLGMLNPFGTTSMREAPTQLQLKAQSVLAERKEIIENLSWQMAALVVAESEKVDAATIDLVAAGRVAANNLGKIFEDKELEHQWESTEETLTSFLKSIDEGDFDIDTQQFSKELFNENILKAQEIARRVKDADPLSANTKRLWMASRKAMGTAANTVFNLGKTDGAFLRHLVTNKFVSKNTQEAFVPDHLIFTLLYALHGDRANMSHPENLAADANGFLSTSAPHLTDDARNIYAHFFSATATRALVYQKVKPADSKQYEPAEYLWANQMDRQEGFKRSTGQWFKNVGDPRISNIGGIAYKTFLKKFTTIQSAFLIQNVTRVFIGHQNFQHAMLGWLLFFFAAQWYFGWPWDWIGAGNDAEEQRIASVREEFASTITLISQGLRDENKSRGQANTRAGYFRLIGLFREYNPEALEIMEKMTTDEGSLELIRQYNEIYNQNSVRDLELTARLNAALKSQDEQGILRASEELKTALADEGLVDENVERLSAENLLAYSTKVSPIYTSAHPAMSVTANWVFGAIGTTVMAIPLSVQTYSPTISALNVGIWGVASIAAINLYNRALNNKGWLAQTLNKRDESKAKDRYEYLRQCGEKMAGVLPKFRK